MRTGDRVAILRPVQNVKVGDMVRGLDPSDFSGWTRVESVKEKDLPLMGASYQIKPHLGAFFYREPGELVEVYLTSNEAAALKAEAMDLLGEE